MRTKLAMGLLLLSGQVFATDLRLGDLNFFQKEDTLLLNTELAFGSGEARFYPNEAISNTFNDLEYSSRIWTNKLSYGIEDRFNVGLALNWAMKNETSVDKSQIAGTGVSSPGSREEDGLSDLILSGAYRLMDEKLFVDLLAGATLALQDREVGVIGDNTGISSKDGNYKQGHHSILLGAAAGKKFTKFEWRVRGGLDYHFAGEQTEMTGVGSPNSVDADTDGYLNFFGEAQLQFRFREKFAVAGELDYIRAGDQESSRDIPGLGKLDRTIDNNNFTVWTVTGKYNFSDTILFKASYAVTPEYDRTGTDKAVGSQDTKTEDITFSTFSLGAELLF